jgi:hypothetical protein
MNKESLLSMIDGLIDMNSQMIEWDPDAETQRMTCIIALWREDVEAGNLVPISQPILNSVRFFARHLETRYDGSTLVLAAAEYFLSTRKANRKKATAA